MDEELTLEGNWRPTTSPCPIWRDSILPTDDAMDELDLSVDTAQQSPLQQFTPSLTPDTVLTSAYRPVISEKMDFAEISMEELKTTSNQICSPSTEMNPKSSNLYPEIPTEYVLFSGGNGRHEGTPAQLLSGQFSNPLPSPLDVFNPSLTPHTLNTNQDMPFISGDMNSTPISMESMDTSSSDIFPPSIQRHPKSSNLYPELSSKHVPFPGGNGEHEGTPGQFFSEKFTDPLPSPLDVFTPFIAPHTLNPNEDMPFTSGNMNSTEILLEGLHASSSKIYLPSTQANQKSSYFYQELSAKHEPFQDGDDNHERRPGHLLTASFMDPASSPLDLFTPCFTSNMMDPSQGMPVISEKVNAKKMKMKEINTSLSDRRPHYIPRQSKSADLHRKLPAEQFWLREGSDGNKETLGQLLSDDYIGVHMKVPGDKASADEEEPGKADRKVQDYLENSISEKCEAAEHDAKYTQHSKEMVATRGYRYESSERFLKSIDQYKENTRSMRRRLADLILENKISRAKLNW